MNEFDFTKVKYDEYKTTIRKWKDRNFSWESIKLARKKTETAVKFYLKDDCNDMNGWPLISIDEWFGLVEFMKEQLEDSMAYEKYNKAAITSSGDVNPSLTIPKSKGSAWVQYRTTLSKKGFREETIKSIEDTTLKTLKLLNSGGHDAKIKGLVVGNVQSGKTANMEAVMAMGADHGWNVFIVLSGIIENLRLQTQSRILNDLNKKSNFTWSIVEPGEIKSSLFVDNLDFSGNKKNRYIITSLKNTTRLKNLIKKLHEDKNKSKQMKIIIFDDEADQASINSVKLSKGSSTINKEVKCLANGDVYDKNKDKALFGAINYIGYTATPYANVLNEIEEGTLFPRDFILSLPVSNEYFGPQQIFGLEEDYEDQYIYHGLDIVRKIPLDEICLTVSIQIDGGTIIPKEMSNAIAWFVCSTAVRRYNREITPSSMLIHTSQRVMHHDNIAELVKHWFSRDNSLIIEECNKIWEEETSRFTKNDFKEQYPNYFDINGIMNYPSFDEIEKEILVLVSELTTIKMNIEGEVKFSKGTHLCIDNGNYSKIQDDDEYFRIIYPNKKDDLDFASAFIVIGGQTLSRGLTLEGLVSTYFLRTTSTADTLMQMGRWFGYRKGYELLPRIWLSEKCINRFEMIASIDYELRKQIEEMDKLNKKPIDFGVKVKNSPKVSFLRITARNKAQSAQEVDIDFTGLFNQTTVFDSDIEIIKSNLDLTRNFLAKLPNPLFSDTKNGVIEKGVIFKNIEFNRVKEYLLDYKISQYSRLSYSKEPIITWVEAMISSENKYEMWNIILVSNSVEKHSCFEFGDYKTRSVGRSQLSNETDINDKFNIGVLTSPKDIIADMNENDVSQDEITKLIKSRYKGVRKFRSDKGYQETPQLIIYIIDGKSEPDTNTKKRCALNFDSDIAGFAIHIPGNTSISKGYAKNLMINIENKDIFDGCDVDDTTDKESM